MRAPTAKEKFPSICRKARCTSRADRIMPAIKMMEAIS